MQLQHLARLLRVGELRFEKFGLIDRVSDFPEGTAAHVDTDSLKRLPKIPFLHSALRIVGMGHRGICYARSKRGWHTSIILTERMERAELIAFQCCLGDDPMRGLMNLFRIIQIRKSGGELSDFWKQRHNILYSRKIQ